MGEGQRFSSWESAVPEDNPVSNGRRGAHFRAGQGPGFKDRAGHTATWGTDVPRASPTPVLQKEDRGALGVRLWPRVSTSSPSKWFWPSDPGKGMKAVSSLALRFKGDLDLWRYIQAYIHPFPSCCPFLLRNFQGHDPCQEKRVAGQSWEGAPAASGQGVLDQEISVNPSPGISKNMAKKF